MKIFEIIREDKDSLNTWLILNGISIVNLKQDSQIAINAFEENKAKWYDTMLALQTINSILLKVILGNALRNHSV